MTTAMSGDSPMQQQKGDDSLAHASYVPHDLKYDADFEDSLIQMVLHPTNSSSNCIRVLSRDSSEQPIDGQSVRAQDVAAQNLPNIAEDELPLSLGDARRIYSSPVSGIKLTHPGGYLEGGPGLEPDMDTFPDDFLANHPQVTTPAQLRDAVQKEIDVSVEHLKGRLRARQQARARNEDLERQIKVLTDQHSMEEKIHNRMQEEKTRKKEAKEKKKREREQNG